MPAMSSSFLQKLILHMPPCCTWSRGHVYTHAQSRHIWREKPDNHGPSPLRIVDSLRRRANARNVSFRISLRWPIHIINSVDKTKFSFIAGFQCHAIQNKNQNRPESEKRKKVHCKYAKTLAKIQVTMIFLMQDMWRNF